MKNKAFTLIEMLAVILILSMLVLIGAKSISTIVKKSKVELSGLQIQSIKEAAKTLANDNLLYLPSESKCKYITLDDLYEYGYFEDKVIDPKNNEEYKSVYVSVCSNKNELLNKISYDYDVKYLNDLDRPEVGMNPFFLAEPDLYNNSLTPIVYVRLTYADSSHTGTPTREILNGTEVITATSDNEVYEWQVPYENDVWYDYPNQMWANAVVLDNGVEKSPGDSVDVDLSDGSSDAVGMFVWISRYSYTYRCNNLNDIHCFGNYDYADMLNASKTQGAATRGAIDVKFVSIDVKQRGKARYTSDKKNSWYTMSAFTLLDNDKIIELDGIWIGKFNPSVYSGSGSYITSNLKCTERNCMDGQSSLIDNASLVKTLPYTKILGNNPHKSMYYLFQNFSKAFGKADYIDSHMIKNSEWSTAAYLSQSLYGKYGNISYFNENKQVYKNSAELITGKSNGAIEALDSCSINSSETFSSGCDSQYNYDYLIDNKDGKGSLGAGASTTGNIYGVYDMVGAGLEYTMFNTNNFEGQGAFTTSELENLSMKYIDKFNKEKIKCNGEDCLGQGFDIARFYMQNWVSSSAPYCVRGTYYNCLSSDCRNNIFHTSHAKGLGENGGSSRNTSRMAIFKAF